MISKLLKAIIIGPPGSGKGTVAERIARDFGVKHLSSGDVLRSHTTNQTAVGLKVKDYLDKGLLVPDDVMVELFLDEIHHVRNNSFLLDGFPRTVHQAESLMEKEELDAVLHLDVPSEVIVHRIKSRWIHPGSGRVYNTEFNPPKLEGLDDVTGEPLIQREDDKEETVRARLGHYEELTMPVLHFYRQKGVLTEFQGLYTNEIWPKMFKYLCTIATPVGRTNYD